MTNLLILVLLKALIFSAGLLGAGNWGQYARARQFDGKYIALWCARVNVPHIVDDESVNAMKNDGTK